MSPSISCKWDPFGLSRALPRGHADRGGEPVSGPDGVDPDEIDTDVFDPRVFARGVPHDALRLLRDAAPVSWQAYWSAY